MVNIEYFLKNRFFDHFGGRAPNAQKCNFLTIFREFFSEIEKYRKTFLEVKQDPQAGP